MDQVVDSSLLKRYGTLDEQAAAITWITGPCSLWLAGPRMIAR